MQAQNQQAQEQYQRDFAKFAADEDTKFDKAMPAVDKELSAAAVTTLRNVGFSDADLRRAYHGEASISLRDHRAQLLVAKAALYDRAIAETPQKRSRSVPPVTRPGTSGEHHDDYSSNQISELSQKLSRSGNLKDAARLLAARRAR